MTWYGGFSHVFKGVRTFELQPCNDGSTKFLMEESFSGLLVPFVKGSLRARSGVISNGSILTPRYWL